MKTWTSEVNRRSGEGGGGRKEAGRDFHPSGRWRECQEWRSNFGEQEWESQAPNKVNYSAGCRVYAQNAIPASSLPLWSLEWPIIPQAIPQSWTLRASCLGVI